MSKKIISILIIISIMISFAACSFKIGSKNADVSKPASTSKEQDKPGNEPQGDGADGDLAGILGGMEGLAGILGNIEGAGDLSSMMESVLTEEKGWPSGSVPEELHEYTEGEIVRSGGTDDEITILIDNTDADALDNYMNKLKEAGWIITTDYDEQKIAVLGLHTLRLDWRSPRLKMTITTLEQGSWPYNELPPDLLPPETGTLVGGIDIEYHGDMMYFVYTFDGMDEDAADNYMMMLVDNGWEGDDMYVSKTIEWNGKKYNASVEVYEIIETRSSFVFNMNPVD